MEQLTQAHSPPPEDYNYQPGGENRYAIKLANALRVRLQYARLKVSSGMTNKNLQEVEEAMIPKHQEETGEQEAAAAARTIMMLSTNRDTPTYYNTPSPIPAYNQPPSLFDVVAQDRSYYQKSREIGQQLPRLSHDTKHRQFKQQRKKSRDHHSDKDPSQPTKPYTAPRRGRPKKVPS